MADSFIDSVRGITRQAVRFLLPVECAACGLPLTDSPIPCFCIGCWNSIVPIDSSRCARCGYPFLSPAATSHAPDHTCQSCRKRPPSYTKAWTLYPYRSPLREALHLFKYQGKVSLAAPLARLITDRLPRFESLDVIVPVPLHIERLREREFNQSLLLADRIGRHLGLPVSCTDLIRCRPAPPQISLRRKERLKNLRGAFTVLHPRAVAGKRILLIDDVFTTGATINECAKALRKAGSSDVFALTLGRTMDASHVPDRLFQRRDGRPSG
ncbi:MAG: ComF family protein [Nitrospira sp.]|nr:ComF family protein [Nitrospira sp.]MCP9462323.1 ComF family protein [Nitrospira sp.]MCP9474625.1 ComF family protein [Nitrospira sp.]